jgi:2-C-methyl-D-erythritol 4-phosphate cytidylyltransferase
VNVAIVPVSRLSFKVTTPEDLELAEALVRSRKPEERKRKPK